MNVGISQHTHNVNFLVNKKCFFQTSYKSKRQFYITTGKLLPTVCHR